MKRSSFAIGLAAVVAMAMTLGNIALAAGQKSETYQKAVSINGLNLTPSNCMNAVDSASNRATTYISIDSVVSALQHVGMKSTWNGDTWNIELPTDMTPASGIQPHKTATYASTSKAKWLMISLNGTPVDFMSMRVQTSSTQSPSNSSQNGAYVPLYYVMKLLRSVNITSTWNGSTWAITVPNRPMYGGNLQLDANGTPSHLDPALAYDTTSESLIHQIYDTLVTYTGASAVLTPDLAQSWTISADGLTYTFHLRSDAKFSNGDSVTAQSFIDEFERVLNSQINSSEETYLDPIVVGATAYHQGTSSTISGVSAPDKDTLVIHLTKPEPFFLQILAMPFFSAVDQSYIDRVGETAFDTTSPLGSGPFVMQSATSTQYVLKKNPLYWGTDSSGNPLPYLNQVTVDLNPNNLLNALNFEKGTTGFLGSFTNGVTSDILPLFQGNSDLKRTLLSQPEAATYYLGMNENFAPFNDVKFRTALEYAIDKQNIVSQFLNGAAEVANQPLPPSIPGYMTNLPSNVNYTYDPTKAEDLLLAAGYPSGQTTVTLDTSNDVTSMKIAQAIQADLQQVGVTCNLNPLPFGQLLTQMQTGKSAFFESAWLQDFPDPSDFLNTLFNSNEAPMNDMTDYSNPQVDNWLNQAQTDMNEQDRLNLYDQVTVQVMQDAAWIPLYYPEQIYAVQPWIHGIFTSIRPRARHRSVLGLRRGPIMGREFVRSGSIAHLDHPYAWTPRHLLVAKNAGCMPD